MVQFLPHSVADYSPSPVPNPDTVSETDSSLLTYCKQSARLNSWIWCHVSRSLTYALSILNCAASSYKKNSPKADEIGIRRLMMDVTAATVPVWLPLVLKKFSLVASRRSQTDFGYNSWLPAHDAPAPMLHHLPRKFYKVLVALFEMTEQWAYRYRVPGTGYRYRVMRRPRRH